MAYNINLHRLKGFVTNPSGQHVAHIEIVERQPQDVEQLGRLHLISFY